jgi:hypothetical protein
MLQTEGAMRIRQYSFLLILLLLAPPLYAQQVFRCKTPDGKVVIRDIPCEGRGVKTEKSITVRHVTDEEYNAASAVHRRNRAELLKILKEDDLTARERAAARTEATAIRARQKIAESGAKQYSDEECRSSLVKEKEMGTAAYQRLMQTCNAQQPRDEECRSSLMKEKEMGATAYRHLMQACASGARQPSAVAAETKAREEAEAAQRAACTPTVINGVVDDCGNSYAPGGGGILVRQDGKVCQQMGNIVQCH